MGIVYLERLCWLDSGVYVMGVVYLERLCWLYSRAEGMGVVYPELRCWLHSRISGLGSRFRVHRIHNQMEQKMSHEMDIACLQGLWHYGG